MLSYFFSAVVGSSWGIMPVGICTSILLGWVFEHGRKRLRKVGGDSPGLRFGWDQPIKNPILVSTKRYVQALHSEPGHQYQRTARVLERTFSLMDESEYLETHLMASHVDGEGEGLSEASQEMIEVRWRSYTWWKAGSRQIQPSKRSKLVGRSVSCIALKAGN